MLSTLLRADSGTVRVLGHDLSAGAAAVRGHLALAGQAASLDDDLTGAENLWLQARLRGLPDAQARERAAELLTDLRLDDAATRRLGECSGGMRRRVDLACALVTIPRLLFLDEPTTGLDPVSRVQMWDRIRDLSRSGTTVLLTTQYLEEADRLCDRVVVMDRGRVVADDTPAQLKRRVGERAFHLTVAGKEGADAAAEAFARAGLRLARRDVESGTHVLAFRVPPSEERRFQRASGDALAAVLSAGHQVLSYAYGSPTLDEVFLALTGQRQSGDTARTAGRS